VHVHQCHFRRNRMRPSSVVFAVSAAVVVGGCAAAPLGAPTVPAELQPPAGETVFLEALASGVQIYECASKSDDKSRYEWVFRAPEATLVDRAGRDLGTHYAGPTWKSKDGSSVVGVVQARDPGPSASAIPWLLLRAKSTAGSGILGGATYIQRVDTVGGATPSATCDAANATQIARIPYTATYYFYRSAP
ncbi:MAG TPA: DUF3455 domain-containing protein, partial [Burkholderiales bacterium]|nr:DUF3455 domain-containing protein [Burkholderiales bacterium]